MGATRYVHAVPNTLVLIILLLDFGEAFVHSVRSSLAATSSSTTNLGRPTTTTSTDKGCSVALVRRAKEEGEAGNHALSSLTKHDAPPALSVPVFSLATVNEDGSTNMNIVSYASPVGIQPERLWMVSLYKTTLSYENFVREGWGVLQFLRRKHLPLVPILGQSCGRDTDKAGRCSEEAFPWDQTSCIVLPVPQNVATVPDCASYIMLRMVSKQPAGDHDAIICQVESTAGPDEGASSSLEILETGHLRDAGII